MCIRDRFGRNFPSLTVQLNDTDSWAAPTVERKYGPQYPGHTFDRLTSYWAIDLTAQSYYYEARRLTVYAGTVSPFTPTSLWREHQFSSTEGGTRYYLVGTPIEGVPRVWEIEDNTSDTLILREEPDTPSLQNSSSFDLDLAIYSSTFAASLDAALPGTFTGSGGSAYVLSLIHI